MVVELIRDEIVRNYLGNLKVNEFFYLHCSPAFADAFKREVTEEAFKMGFSVERNEDEPLAPVDQYHLPLIGTIKLLKDMVQGYRLECVTCGTEPKAALPEGVTIIKEFPHLSNTYIVDGDSLVKGDVLLFRNERYEVLTDAMEYGEGDGTYKVYTLDKPVPTPIGARLAKDKSK